MVVLKGCIVMITSVRRTPELPFTLTLYIIKACMYLMYLKDLFEIDYNQILKIAGY